MMRGLDASMTASASKATFSAKSVMAGFASIGKVAATAGIVVAGASLKMAADFDKVAREVNTMADLSEGAFDRLKSDILEMSRHTEHSAKGLMQGMYWIKSAMPDASVADTMKVLEASSELAIAGLSDMADTADLVTTALNAWGLSAESSTHVTDVLFETVRRGKTKISELTANFSKAASAAALMNVPIEDLGAATATLTRIGIPADRTLMALNRVLLGMNKPTKETAEWIRSLGYANAQAMVDAIGLKGVLTELSRSFGGNAEAMAAMFPNIRELLALLPLTGKNFGDIMRDFEEFADVTGTVERATGQMRKTFEYQFKEMKNKVGAVLIDLGEKIMPVARNAVDGLGRIVEGKNAAFNTLGKLLSSAAGSATGFASALASVKPALYGVIAALGALKLVGVFSAGPSTIAGGFTALHTAIANTMPMLVATHPLITGLGVAGIAAAAGIGFFISEIKREDEAAEKAAQALVRHQKEQGDLAASTYPLITKLEEARAQMNNAAEGSDEYAAAADAVKDIQNEIAANFPSLVAGWDAERNATLKSTEELKRNLAARMGIAGIKMTTPGTTPEFQNLEVMVEQGQKASENFDTMASKVQDLAEAFSDAGLETSYLGYLTDAWYRSAEDGASVTMQLLSQLSDTGKLANEDLFNIAKILHNLQGDVTLFGGTLDHLNQQIIASGPAVSEAAATFIAKMREEGKAGGEVPKDIITAFTSAVPQFQEVGVQALSAWIQGASSIEAGEANKLAQQLFNTGEFKATGEAAVDAALTAVKTALQQSREAAKEDIEVGIKVDDKGTAGAIKEALSGVEKKAKDVDKLKPKTKVSAPGAEETIKQLFRVQSMARQIPREITIRTVVTPGHASTFTPMEPVEIGRWLADGISTGYYANAEKLGAAVSIDSNALKQAVSAMGASWSQLSSFFSGTYFGEYTDELLRMREALAMLTNTNWDVVGSQLATIEVYERQIKEWEIMRLRAVQAGDEQARAAAEAQKAALENALALERTQLELNQAAAASAGLNAQTTDLIRSWRAAKDAMAVYERQMQAIDAVINKLSHDQELLNWEIQKHEENLNRLRQMKIKGEGAREDKSFKLQQEMNKLQLEILKAQQEGRFNDAARLAQDKARLEKQKEIFDLETSVEYDPKRRALEKMLDPLKGQEMSYNDIVKAIKKELDILGDPSKPKSLRGRLKKIEDDLRRQRNRVWELKVEYDNSVKHVQQYEAAINSMYTNFMNHYREMLAAQQELNRAMGQGAGQTGGGLPHYQHGGPVMRTGAAYLHAGEYVLSKAMLASMGAGRSYSYHFDTLEVVLPNVRDYADFARELQGARLRMAVPQ